VSITDLTIFQTIQLIKKGEMSAREVTLAYLDRIEKLNPLTNAYLSINDRALEKADQIDSKKLSSLSCPGIPIALKDNMVTLGMPTTCGSKILQNFHPPYQATVAERLQSSGAIVLGKTNMDEFAMGSSNETSFYSPCCNPWDPDRVPGGSSGGSAAAVAADLCGGALGSDTGGSIRQPASFCSVVGLKPTYGLVSRYGLVAYASSLDQIGPIAKDVTDCAFLLSLVAGHDKRDSTSLPVDIPDYVSALTREIKGLKVGICREYLEEGLEPAVQSALQKALSVLTDLGCQLVEITLPHAKYAVPAYYLVAMAEASSNLSRYDGVKYGFRESNTTDLNSMYRSTRKSGFGQEVKQRIMLGTFALSAGYYDAFYLKAQKVRTLIVQDHKEAFLNCQVLITPTYPTTAFKLGEMIHDPLKMYLADLFTISCNLAGLPGLSIPCGFDHKNLPIGMQIIGPHLQEKMILNVAYAFEQATSWHRKKPETR